MNLRRQFHPFPLSKESGGGKLITDVSQDIPLRTIIGRIMSGRDPGVIDNSKLNPYDKVEIFDVLDRREELQEFFEENEAKGYKIGVVNPKPTDEVHEEKGKDEPADQ